MCHIFPDDANGNKLRKTVSGISQDYLGGIEYTNGAIDAIYHEEGRATPSGTSWQYEYYLKDHLGNTRVIFTDSNDDGTPEIIQEADYYPFGMRHDRSVTATNHYLYNGKELNDELGLDWYDYGARWLDVETGRWSTIDPLAERYASMSPFNYVANNPIINIDPDGRKIKVSNLLTSDEGRATLFSIIYDIRKITGLSLAISKDGYFKIEYSHRHRNRKYSDVATDFLRYLIEDESNEIKLKMSNEGSRVMSRKTPNTVELDFRDVTESINSFNTVYHTTGVPEITYSGGFILLHESLHTQYGASYFPASDRSERRTEIFDDPAKNRYGNYGVKGETVEKVNEMRAEMGLPLRSEYYFPKSSDSAFPLSMWTFPDERDVPVFLKPASNARHDFLLKSYSRLLNPYIEK